MVRRERPWHRQTAKLQRSEGWQWSTPAWKNKTHSIIVKEKTQLLPVHLASFGKRLRHRCVKVHMAQKSWPNHEISRLNFDYLRLVGMWREPLALQRHTGSIKTREGHMLVSSGALWEANSCGESWKVAQQRQINREKTFLPSDQIY